MVKIKLTGQKQSFAVRSEEGELLGILHVLPNECELRFSEVEDLSFVEIVHEHD